MSNLLHKLEQKTLEAKGEAFKCVVRIKTSYYATSRGASKRTDMNVLIRKCSGTGDMWFYEEVANDPETIFDLLPDISKLDDGLYQLTPIYSSGTYEYPDDVSLDDIRITKLEE